MANHMDPERNCLNRGGDNVTEKALIIPSKSISYYVDELYKRGSRREEALPSIIQILTNYRENEFVEKNFATIMFRFLNSIKKGSAKERDLATQALGLFAMTIRCRAKASELYEESIPLLSEALKPGEKNSLTQILQSLAIIGFFCGANSVETENTMQIIWNNIHLDTKSSKLGVADKIKAWCFLLSALDGWRISYKRWKGAIPYFSSLLEDETLHDAALESLALIYEIGALEKFTGELKASKDDSLEELALSSENNVAALGDENETSNATGFLKDDSGQFQKFQKVNKIIGKAFVSLSTYSQRRQLNFLCDLLGSKGLEAQIRENQLIRDVFELYERAPCSSSQLYESEKEKLVKHYFVPVVRADKEDNLLPFVGSKEKAVSKRMNKSSNSSKSKARSQLLNQKRKDAEKDKMGHFLAED